MVSQLDLVPLFKWRWDFNFRISAPVDEQSLLKLCVRIEYDSDVPRDLVAMWVATGYMCLTGVEVFYCDGNTWAHIVYTTAARIVVSGNRPDPVSATPGHIFYIVGIWCGNTAR